jgi:hypothetical protein
MTDAKQLDLMVQQAEKILDDLIDESAEAAEIAGAFRAFIAGVKNIKPDTNVGSTGQTFPVRRYKLVYNYSSVEIEVGGTLEEAEAVISAEYSALKRMSDGPATYQAPDDGWEFQEAPLEWVEQPHPAYQERRPSYGGGGKRPLTNNERGFAKRLGMANAFDPNIDPSAVRRWIQQHK